MKRVKESVFDIGKISKLVWNENVGIMLLMVFGGICHGFRNIHPIFENGCVFMVLVGFLSLVIVEGKDLASNWNRSSKRRGFLTGENIIGLVFLGILLVAGVYAILTIFNAKDSLTIKSFGIFGIIWTLRWIQKLKSFSSARDNVHKLIGPLIAIIILISGYTMHSKNTALGPLSCVLAPATIWFFSLIFGDIEGSNDQDGKINPFAIIISSILLGLVIYAIWNPEMYGIEVLSVDGGFFKMKYKSKLKNYEAAFEKVNEAQAKIDDLKEKEEKLWDGFTSDTKKVENLKTRFDNLENTELPSVNNKLKIVKGKLKEAKSQLTAKEQELGKYGKSVEDIDRRIADLESQVKGKTAALEKLKDVPKGPIMTSVEEKSKEEIENRKSQIDRIRACKEEFTKADNLVKAAEKEVKNATTRFIKIKGKIGKIRDILLPEKKKSRNEKASRYQKISAELKKEQDTLKILKKSPHLTEHAKNRREMFKKFNDAYSELDHAEKTAEQVKRSAADMHEANSDFLKKERKALFS